MLQLKIKGTPITVETFEFRTNDGKNLKLAKVIVEIEGTLYPVSTTQESEFHKLAVANRLKSIEMVLNLGVSGNFTKLRA